MDRIIKKKKPDQAPDWLIYSLKGLLLFLLFWNLNKQFPKGIFNHLPITTSPKKIYSAPSVKEITFIPFLDTLTSKNRHFINWGNKEIPYIDPGFSENAPAYFKVSTAEFTKFYLDSISILYKGHLLTPTTYSAVFIQSDSSIITCEDEVDLTKCFYPNLEQQKGDFSLWLSIETEEGKTFFTKIKIGQSANNQSITGEEAIKFWTKKINKNQHKSIDNLTVAKPIFKTHQYLFKWGGWERYVHESRGGRRVKLKLSELNKWIKHPPYLYKEKEFIPFNLRINFWDKEIGSNYCFIRRQKENESIISTYECYNDLTKTLESGDLLSIFIYKKESDSTRIPKGILTILPRFIASQYYTRLSIPIEIVPEDHLIADAPLKLSTSTFSFQLNSSLGEDAIVKIDANNPKNKTLKTHYSESNSAKIIHISNFKTVRRIITQDDIFIKTEDIEKIYILTEKIYKTDTYPEFYDFNILDPIIKSRGLNTVLDKTIYPLAHFKGANSSAKGMEMYLGTEKVKILQLTLTVIPKEGKAIQYITNNIDRFDINKRLNKLQPETSLYFDKILFERKNGEQLVFPFATALHLK